MILEKLAEPVLITTHTALEELANVLQQKSIIAVDTESNSLFAYREQVCLIQFSTDEDDYLVDPLAVKDLSPLASIFSDPAIEKVFHAAEYDLICLKRDFGFIFRNIFDTMVAARILGRDALGLGAMLEQEYGVQVDKHNQRANWGQRPLPRRQITYAQMDTHYLISLRTRLLEELMQRDLYPLALEDFNRLTVVESGHSMDERMLDCWRISGSFDLEPHQAAVLHELCQYRDQTARALNRPLFKVISDSALLAIAQAVPRDLDELDFLNVLSRGQFERYGTRLIDAVNRGLRSAPMYPPRTPRPNGHYTDRLDALKSWRKQTAERMGVKSDVVLPRDLLLALVEKNPTSSKELASVMKSVPWRLERFGNQILFLLSNGRDDKFLPGMTRGNE